MIWLWWGLNGCCFSCRSHRICNDRKEASTATLKVDWLPMEEVWSVPKRKQESQVAANMIGQRMSQAKVVLGRLLENRWKRCVAGKVRRRQTRFLLGERNDTVRV